MEVRFEKNITCEFMIIRRQTDVCQLEYEEQILHNNELPGVLKFKMKESDEDCCYYYDIKGMKNLDENTQYDTIDYNNALMIINDLKTLLGTIDDYLLSFDSICLDENYIYYSYLAKRYLFVYIPGYCRSFKDQLKELLAWLMKHINYNDKDCVSYIFNLYRKIEAGEDIFAETIPSKDQSDDIKEETSDRYVKDEIITESKNSNISGSNQLGKLKAESKHKEKLNLIPDGEEKNEQGILVKTIIICIILFAFTIIFKNNLSFWVQTWFGIYPLSWIWPMIMLVLGVFTNIIIFAFSRERENKEDEFWDEPVCMDFSAMKEDETTLLMRNSEYPQTQLLEQNCLILIGKSQNYHDMIKVRQYPFTIGKNKALVQYVLDAATVSRRHLQIQYKEDKCLVTDLYSTNGTKINGRSLSPGKAYPIENGDHLQIAELIFEVKITD